MSKKEEMHEDIGLDAAQVDEIRKYMTKGEFAAALAVVNASSAQEVPGLAEDIADALSKPPGAEQWACVRRPDLVASLMGIANGDELIMHACEAAVHWAIPSEGTDPELYAFTRELHPFVMELVSDVPSADSFKEYAEEMMKRAMHWTKKATEIQSADAGDELEPLINMGKIALAGRYSEAARMWSMLCSHAKNCEEGPDCVAGKMTQRIFLEQAVGLIQGCHLQMQVCLRQRADYDKQSPETIHKARMEVVYDCARVMREAVPYTLLRAYADGTVQRANCSKEIN